MQLQVQLMTVHQIIHLYLLKQEQFHTVVPVFQAPPVFVMIVSQAFSAVILPVTVLCILYLGNRGDLMGEHKNTYVTNLVLIAILLFSIMTSWMGIQSVWQLVMSS